MNMSESSQDVEQYTEDNLQDMLPIYYKRLFPHQLFFKWLNYGLSESSLFTHREFSFTLKDDVYIRYLSFENGAELEKEMCTRNPFKIDIGAVMSVRPKSHRTTVMVPLQRELVFDIDLTDYDDVRTCCSGADICSKCWKFMAVACRIIDTALREDFNFEHILWVFSGRRGIHCWVCDKIARHMANKRRSAVAEYLNIIQIINNSARVIIGERMHHSIKRALQFIEPVFEEVILTDQNLFGTVEGRKLLTSLIPDEKIRADLEAKISAIEEGNSKAVWDLVKRYFATNRGPRRMNHIIEEIQLSMMYPRLDIMVSKTANHLLKAPFCVHPKTGKICVPINASAVAKFDPLTVPTIGQLLKDVDMYDDKNAVQEIEEPKNRNIQGYRKTGLNKGIFVFHEFLHKLDLSFKKADKLSVMDSRNAKLEI